MASLQLEYHRGDLIAEKYEIVDRLDQSPLGITYRARHVQKGSYVRLLLLDPAVAGREHKQQLIDAWKLSRATQHRNLLKVGELGQHAGVAFVAMEDFDGQTLRDLIHGRHDEGTPFTLREAAQVTMQALEGCRALHDTDHVFRALRPEYVLVKIRHTGPGGRNVVVDVRLIGAGLWDLVAPGKLAEDEFDRGEAQYLAPELKGVQPKPTPRSDVYSAGVIFYEMLVGQAPVGTYQLPRQRRPDLPAHIDAVAELSLAVSPDDRYPTPADFIADIQRSFQQVDEPDPELAPRAMGPLVWILGAVLVGAIIVMVVSQTSGDPYEQALATDNALRKDVYDQHPRPGAAEVREILAQHPANMMYIPPGPFVSGRLDHEPRDAGGEKAAVVELPGYLIDVFEYPNLQGAPPQHEVTWTEAAQTCEDAGKRLCSADELEKACKGPENHIYGYGDTWDADFCGVGTDDVHPSGAFQECKSNWGVYDIAGNFREWTSTPRGDSRRLVKGGLPQSAERGTRCAYATDLSPGYTDPTISFRCCRDLDAPPVEAEAAE